MRRKTLIALIGASAIFLTACGGSEEQAQGQVSSDSSFTAGPPQGPQVPEADPEEPEVNQVVINPDAQLPEGVLSIDEENAFGWQVNGPIDPNKPTLTLFEDYQCSFCARLKKEDTDSFLLEQDDYNLVIRPTGLRDFSLGNESSRESTGALGCAIDQGVGLEYRANLYKFQDPEGLGFTKEFLIESGKEMLVGEENKETFERCVKEGSYADWAYNSTALLDPNDFSGTPSLYLGEEEIPIETVFEIEDLISYLDSV